MLQPTGEETGSPVGEKNVEAFSGAVNEFIGREEALITRMKADLDIADNS